jgi:hypothetical protein
MKKINTAILPFLFLILIIDGCSGGKGPAIVIDGELYRFGEVIEGKEVVFTFFFTNPGAKNLVIEELYVSCECVVIKEYDRVVPPGKRGKIYGVIKTEGFLGLVSKSIKLKTNIPDIEPVLTMEGTIRPKPE